MRIISLHKRIIYISTKYTSYLIVAGVLFLIFTGKFVNFERTKALLKIPHLYPLFDPIMQTFTTVVRVLFIFIFMENSTSKLCLLMICLRARLHRVFHRLSGLSFSKEIPAVRTKSVKIWLAITWKILSPVIYIYR